MRKLIALAGAAALIAGMVTPALGFGGWSRPTPSWDVDVAMVSNTASANAETGENVQTANANANGGDALAGDQFILTGDAYSRANAMVVANTEVNCDCGAAQPNCGGRCGSRYPQQQCPCPENDVDLALVGNHAEANADTGNNVQVANANANGVWRPARPCAPPVFEGGNATAGYQFIQTGSAWSESSAFTLVNTELSR